MSQQSPTWSPSLQVPLSGLPSLGTRELSITGLYLQSALGALHLKGKPILIPDALWELVPFYFEPSPRNNRTP
jgi:hypothetical protein